jgi:hypothetical protein
VHQQVIKRALADQLLRFAREANRAKMLRTFAVSGSLDLLIAEVGDTPLQCVYKRDWVNTQPEKE